MTSPRSAYVYFADEPGRRAQPTIFDVVSRLGSATATVCECQELLASDTLTPASRHGVTAGETVTAQR